jgi:DNA-binding LytR/AlgR family response regulator
MSVLRVMVVDDEPLAIERLADLLGQIEDTELVGAHQNAADAVKVIPELRPDLILVDVEMPKVDGFDFVEALVKQGWIDTQSTPCIAFVTAYPQFASAAFETGALDFLCKPVRLSRLEKAIDRARTTLAQRDALRRLHELAGQLDALRVSQTATAEPSLWVHQRGQMMRVALQDLDWVEAEGEYVRLHVRGQSYLLRSSISALAEKLITQGFIRIHRSTIINQTRLSALRSSRAGMKVVLESGEELPVGRKYRSAVRALRHSAASI